MLWNPVSYVLIEEHRVCSCGRKYITPAFAPRIRVEPVQPSDGPSRLMSLNDYVEFVSENHYHEWFGLDKLPREIIEQKLTVRSCRACFEEPDAATEHKTIAFARYRKNLEIADQLTIRQREREEELAEKRRAAAREQMMELHKKPSRRKNSRSAQPKTSDPRKRPSWTKPGPAPTYKPNLGDFE